MSDLGGRTLRDTACPKLISTSIIKVSGLWTHRLTLPGSEKLQKWERRKQRSIKHTALASVDLLPRISQNSQQTNAHTHTGPGADIGRKKQQGGNQERKRNILRRLWGMDGTEDGGGDPLWTSCGSCQSFLKSLTQRPCEKAANKGNSRNYEFNLAEIENRDWRRSWRHRDSPVWEQF